MSRLTVLSCCIALLFACRVKKEEVPATGESKNPVESAKASDTGAKPDAKAAAENAAKSATDNLKKAADAAKQVLDPAKVAESGFSVDQLKQSLSSLSTDNLKQIGDQLVTSLKTNGDTAKNLQDQIGKLGLADIAKAGELKTSLEAATKLASGLKDKLKIVADQLKANGVDVSKYTAMLGG